MILVTGASGQLACEFMELLSEDEARFLTRAELDISSRKMVSDICKKLNVETIINCAAYTAVDQAEKSYEEADVVNRIGPKVLADVCREQGIYLIHFSTDYVFDGESEKPYKETDMTNPLSVYGKTKRDGELEIEKSGCDSAIFRVSWLYSSHHKNFYLTMKKLCIERDVLKVVSDQIGAPTYARDLAQMVVSRLEIIRSKKGSNMYHFSNEGICSWYEFAQEICRQVGGKAKVLPIPTSEYPTPAARPKSSALDKALIIKELNVVVPHWKDGLRSCISRQDIPN